MIDLALLAEPHFRVALADASRVRLSLPEVLARVSVGEALVFLALRPHQQPAWHAFLVQLACLALEAAGWPPLPLDASGWRSLLRGLTTRWPEDQPWCLVVDDWAAPAFLQPPGAPGDYRGGSGSAQELDLLVTSKNHDEKIGKLHVTTPDEADVWAYALVSLQGFAGYLGRGNFSSMRMNGGFASRPQFRLVFRDGAGAEFLRDVQALRESMDDLWRDAETVGIGTDDDPLRLLWLEPWTETPLPLARVHPLCLEVTRRVRLRADGDGGLKVLTAPSRSMRVAARESNGNVLDPWIPIVKEGGARALTAQADAFTYHRLAPLLFDDRYCQLPRLALPTAAERDTVEPATLRMQVLVGGSGRTAGCLRRDVPMPPAVRRHFFTRRAELALRAQAFIDLAAAAQGAVLRAALLQYVDGSEDVDWKNKDFAKAVSPWVTALERRIDEVFFDDLFATETEPPMPDAQARRLWVQRLRDLTTSVFEVALRSLPTRDRSRQLARGRAQRMLSNGMRAHLGDDASPRNAEPKQRASRGRDASRLTAAAGTA